MTRIMAVCIAAGLMLSAAAQEGLQSGYSKMQIEKVGRCEGTFGGSFSIQKMTGGVRIKLIADDPAQKDLPISADTMSIDWPDGEDRPKKLILEGNVKIDHPQGAVSAQRAEWDFESGLLVFTGNPVMNGEMVKQLHASKMTLNFKTNKFEMSDMSAKEIPVGGVGGAGATQTADPNLLKEGDVKDWAGLLGAIKADLGKKDAAPGKQLAAKLAPEAQAALKSMAPDALMAMKDKLLKEINRVVQKPGLYSQAAWEGLALNDELKGLLDKKGLSPAEQTRQNRLLLEAAYPSFLGRP